MDMIGIPRLYNEGLRPELLEYCWFKAIKDTYNSLTIYLQL